MKTVDHTPAKPMTVEQGVYFNKKSVSAPGVMLIEGEKHTPSNQLQNSTQKASILEKTAYCQRMTKPFLKRSMRAQRGMKELSIATRIKKIG
jgi:hypothetical protein